MIANVGSSYGKLNSLVRVSLEMRIKSRALYLDLLLALRRDGYSVWPCVSAFSMYFCVRVNEYD